LLLYALYTLFILACAVLILCVLLQPGKADAGSLFTSSFSSTAFGPRGTQTLLAKITIVAAALFMLVALLISMGVGGYRSVVGAAGDAPPAPAQSAPAQTDAPPPPAPDAAAPQGAPAQGTAGPDAAASPAASPAQ
jgi:preprotein translocase subunit SecG